MMVAIIRVTLPTIVVSGAAWFALLAIDMSGLPPREALELEARHVHARDVRVVDPSVSIRESQLPAERDAQHQQHERTGKRLQSRSFRRSGETFHWHRKWKGQAAGKNQAIL